MSPLFRGQGAFTCWNCERTSKQATEIELLTPSGATTILTLCDACLQTVYLPLAPSAPELRLRALRSRKVLVVEDDPGMRSFLEMALEIEGYQVSSATNGVEALRSASEDAPDAIVLDLNLPVMNGQQFLRAWRQFSPTPSAPVIAISAQAFPPIAEELGVSTFLPKPLEYATFVGTLAALFKPQRLDSGEAAL